MEDNINAFEMWIFRRMFMTSYLDRNTNVEFLEMAKAKQTLLSEETTLFLTLHTRKGKTKTTNGRKNRRDKMLRKAKKDLIK